MVEKTLNNALKKIYRIHNIPQLWFFPTRFARRPLVITYHWVYDALCEHHSHRPPGREQADIRVRLHHCLLIMGTHLPEFGKQILSNTPPFFLFSKKLSLAPKVHQPLCIKSNGDFFLQLATIDAHVISITPIIHWPWSMIANPVIGVGPFR